MRRRTLIEGIGRVEISDVPVDGSLLKRHLFMPRQMILSNLFNEGLGDRLELGFLRMERSSAAVSLVEPVPA